MSVSAAAIMPPVQLSAVAILTPLARAAFRTASGAHANAP